MNDPGARPEIEGKVENMEEYAVIFVGFPIWWYREPSIIDTFLDSYDFKGKTIVPFATSGMSGIGNSAKSMERLVPGAKVVTGKRFEVSVSPQILGKWAGEWTGQ